VNPQVASFFDPATSTFTHVLHDREGGHAAVVDPVLDYDPAIARTSTASADRVLQFVRDRRLQLDWILETHAHAEHLSAAAYLKSATGARVGIGRGITRVQAHFKALFGLEEEFAADGSQFDRLFDDGDTFPIGGLQVRVIATPGHTADSLTFLVGDAAFVGDTLFAPATGTARVDFPGGDAHELYRSIRRLFELPDDTRLFLCHDYPPAGGEAPAMHRVEAQRSDNVHVGAAVDEAAFVRMRNERDAGLAPPRLILPALLVNIRAGELPPLQENGIRYLRIPLNRLGGAA
jgi:glyoxylase-like metal-dependent hydrolase (beta-lactamase superfamily II)